MKTFLIIIGCILLYIFFTFITFIIILYIKRCEYRSRLVYKSIDEEEILWLSLAWPLTIWFYIPYILYMILKKYAIAIVEIIYQVFHKGK